MDVVTALLTTYTSLALTRADPEEKLFYFRPVRGTNGLSSSREGLRRRRTSADKYGQEFRKIG